MVRVSLDGNLLASCSNDQTVRVWQAGGKDVKVEMRDHDHVVECVAWAPEAATQAVNEAARDAAGGDNKNRLVKFVCRLVAQLPHVSVQRLLPRPLPGQREQGQEHTSVGREQRPVPLQPRGPRQLGQR